MSRMVGNLGYETYLAADSTATINNKGIERTNYPAELIHEAVLASLHPEFATIIITDFIKRSILSVLTIK